MTTDLIRSDVTIIMVIIIAHRRDIYPNVYRVDERLFNVNYNNFLIAVL